MTPMRDNRLIRHFLHFCLAILCLVACGCLSSREKTFKETRTAMHTITSVTVVAGTEQKASGAIEAAFVEIGRLEKLMNYYADDSEVSAINHSAGVAPVRVSPETMEVIEKALFVSAETYGAFDITVGPLVRLWDFRTGKIPEAADISRARERVDYTQVKLDKNTGTVFLENKGMEIDLGGILKGYAADRAAAVLRKEGIASGIVTVGGEVKAFGVRPDGTAWKVGVTNPRKRGPDDEIMATVRLSDKAISTSGDYERFFIRDGLRYHHVLDPATGSPGPLCRSVTVVTDEGAMSDAFATAVFILGPDKGMEVLTRLGFDGIIIASDGVVHTTKGLEGRVEYLLR